MKTLSEKSNIYLGFTHFANVFLMSVGISILLLFLNQSYFINQIIWSIFIIIGCIYGVWHLHNNHIIKNPLKISIISSISFIILRGVGRILSGAYGLAPELSDYERLHITFNLYEIIWGVILLLIYFFYTYIVLIAKR